MSQKPTLPKGTRDFGPQQMAKRNFVFSAIKEVFEKYGFMPLETPAMENLSVLTGKYGDEGDQLLFKILNSGDFLSNADVNDFNEGSRALLPKIAEKGLKYDLTVPFARYVVMNRHELTLPFKRYQIQPVWRADRPQKGRYREFFQCDADVVGTDSLICEAEIVLMINEVFSKLGIDDFNIKINHRQILTGITEAIGAGGKESDFCVSIDKLDKIGLEKVLEEMKERGISPEATEKAVPILQLQGSIEEKIAALKDILKNSDAGQKGISDIEEALTTLKSFDLSNHRIDFDVTLARGLSYYTGAIFEVKVKNVSIGSVSGGGRYDDLTGVFGMSGLSGVGFSFGVDRIYDVMEELNLFPKEALTSTEVLIIHFDEASMKYGLSVLGKLRRAGIKSEIYPDQAKIKKQFNYADKKNIQHTIVIGSEEVSSGKLTLRNMVSGQEEKLTIEEIIHKLQSTK
ncbi:Histidyl-tRNA synthetase [Fulvivirga imtechensis AK7]|uniref:Histidine--tRNA ligase n=1 Tax=Fulvivirga imtechensis AK7 TaxID=1237149 RepID=L8JM46_9BACT|nr:histidine--tRNA ligase [Fulvivirga imtechensis]ELR70006.1 Histidyl-tRNA synthetase [Fulvivirga imtechensis AK7]